MNVQLDSAVTGTRHTPHPRPPKSLEDTGLDREFLLDLLIKTVYRLNLQLPSQMAVEVKLPVPLVEDLLVDANEKRLIETLGQRGASLIAEMRYQLTTRGREWALQALQQSEWVGPAPVPVEQYTKQAKAQSIRSEVLTRPMLDRVFSNLTLDQSLMDQIGPAVNSGQSILLYGPPGNGKTSIAVAVCAAYQDYIFLPYAIEVDKQVITLFDPTVHSFLEDSRGSDGSIRHDVQFDPRYVKCKRPIVITGGELTLDMLDLSYSPVSRVYEAPLQLKASGGIIVIDDFGRQRQSPQALVNRLIIPLENNIDYLSLQTGRKFQVPYDALTLLSTNINPRDLVDGAALRRLRYKILVDSPDLEIYVEIFNRTAEKFGLKLTEEVLSFILFDLYENQEGAKFQAFHPRFLIEQTLAICTFEGTEPQLRPDYLRRAWRNLFTEH
ncbi:MAG: AAA family ATPase [Paracoccaceae bacterium]